MHMWFESIIKSSFQRLSFAIAITCVSLSADANPVSDWDLAKLNRVLAELATAGGECEKTLSVNTGRLLQLFDILSEKAAVAGSSYDEKRQLNESMEDVISEYKMAPATFCWSINEKYGPRGTLLPGMTTAR